MKKKKRNYVGIKISFIVYLTFHIIQIIYKIFFFYHYNQRYLCDYL